MRYMDWKKENAGVAQCRRRRRRRAKRERKWNLWMAV